MVDDEDMEGLENSKRTDRTEHGEYELCSNSSRPKWV
jgi:hypothetical protein